MLCYFDENLPRIYLYNIVYTSYCIFYKKKEEKNNVYSYILYNKYKIISFLYDIHCEANLVWHPNASGASIAANAMNSVANISTTRAYTINITKTTKYKKYRGKKKRRARANNSNELMS